MIKTSLRQIPDSKEGNLAYLHGNLCLVRPASSPYNQAKRSEQEHKTKQGNQSLKPPCKRLVLEFIVSSFFHDHITLGPPLVIPLPGSFSPRGRPENPRKPAGRGVPRVAPERRVRRRLHWAVVVDWSGLQRRGLVAIMRIP